ncbi:MAG: hypothetical protein Q9169_005824 [Polycauliona sp. 2 TL-2023]
MDLIQGIGERYLMGKANAAPQQFEDYAKKQFKGDTAAVPAKARTATPDIGTNKELEELRKQLAEVKASQKKSAAAPSGRRQSVETAVSRGRSRRPRALNESPPVKEVPAAEKPNHHGDPENGRRKAQATENTRETIKTPSSSSVKAPTTHPVTLNGGYRESLVPHSQPKAHSIPAGRSRESHSMIPSVHSHKTADYTKDHLAMERPIPANDLCVVEVMEEESQSRRRDRRTKSHVVEVIEKKGNRTRYAIG